MAVAGLFLFEAMRHSANVGDIIMHGMLISVGISSTALALAWFVRKTRRGKLRIALLAAGVANPLQLSPKQYEQFCAALLSNNGWNARLTGKSGDFGADVVATKEDQVLVIQCKQWTQSVGIRAVQEAHAALSHYHATHAAVVTTTGYTAAARSLAKSTGVRLLSHADLVCL